MNKSLHKSLLGLIFFGLTIGSGCRTLAPVSIDNSKQNIAPELVQANQIAIERGKPRLVLDCRAPCCQIVLRRGSDRSGSTPSPVSSLL